MLRREGVGNVLQVCCVCRVLATCALVEELSCVQTVAAAGVKGTRKDTSASSGCVECEVGRYSASEDQAACMDCAVGTFAPAGKEGFF